ncbi:sacsin N-terminal ATP-binding-like domain-containing protein [Sinorhizobium fredii]|uniref:sacsin N-terminal ATP-binding-like domain-containing protein n=1 Tax=Rhizobium fredii TaxID=380 RepID=UPI003513C68D
MRDKPAYFEAIREKAAKRWDQLEQDPELAGPWHQLFKQVQSPRHILSELLQNADDAGATEAFVRIEDRFFVFEHNGEDFAEEHFASLCRFGYSNKRALHTIGFRGIGFKSTFSLGDRVELYSPSLSIFFDRQRFTEPRWTAKQIAVEGRTQVRVEISDQHRLREVEKNLEEWLKSPLSLLFFKNIRRMRIGEREVHWGSLGLGPVPESEWMALHEKQDETFLLIRSDAEAFPEEALAEIRQERMLGTGDETAFPPCKVEIVLGGRGRLYVVLPTGVESDLPFACNAPFIQDPARLKIKDPETSPTNRWLLERAGRLAAGAMLRWLEHPKLSLAERARAYGLFPDVDREQSSLEGVCGTIAEEAFDEAINDTKFLLMEDGQLAPKKRSVIIPGPILDVWAPAQAAALLDEDGRPPLCQHVVASDRKKLLHWGVIDEIDKPKLLGILQQKHLPKPESWRQLLILWAYVAPDITGYRHYVSAVDVRIVPVQGRDVLYAADEVVRLGEKKLLQSEDDWDFLAKFLIVLNQNWTRFLADQRRTASEQKGTVPKEDVEAAYAVLKEIGLDDTSDVNKVIDQVAAEFFSQDSVELRGCIRLAQIAAKLGANVGDAFRYASRDRCLRSTEKSILFDEDGRLEELIPKVQRETELLHPDYSKSFSSCSREDWQKWIASGRSNLLTFVPLIPKRVSVYGKRQIEQEAHKRGLRGELSYPYVTHQFLVEDWDFEDSFWRHWKTLADDDERIWVNLVERILAQREAYWTRAKNARLLQVATTGNTRAMTYSPGVPSWVLRLRELPCLPDTRGFHRKPGDLLRRTPETESLMDLEPFIHGLLDRDTTRPLLELLGVRDKPTGPDRLLDCLRALSKAAKPPVSEVEKWYRRLDQMVTACSTADFQKIRQALRSEKLVLTHDGTWVTASAVFLSSDDEDVPDAAVIRPSVYDLTLWRKIGVADRPTADLALGWLKTLHSGSALSLEDARRVRALLVRHPLRIWEECAHWLNLAGEWAPASSLSYALTMQSLVPWRHLHQWVKQKTADFQRLPSEATSSPPFSDLPALSFQIEERFQTDHLFAGQPVNKDWLRTFGADLSRIELDSEKETRQIRTLAQNLAETDWLDTAGVEVIPYIDGTPAGTPRQVDVIWLGRALCVEKLSKAKLARRVPEEIGKVFARSDIKAALDYSFERSAADVREYLEENFKLSAAVALPEPVGGLTAERAEEGDVSGISSIEGGVGELSAAESERDHRKANDRKDNDDEAPIGDTDEQTIIEGVQTHEPRPRPTPKPIKPTIMERFAKSHGFRKDGDERFFHSDGSWIGRVSSSPFPWERRSNSGELLRHYLPLNKCLEREPVEIEADVWGLLEQRPDVYALIAPRADDSVTEFTGFALTQMREAKTIILYPATYRLVHDSTN